MSVGLFDSIHLVEESSFISASLVALSMMMALGLAHVNVLGKIDLVKSYGSLSQNIRFFLDGLDFGFLAEGFEMKLQDGVKENDKKYLKLK